MAKLPCPPQSRIFTLKDTGETMSYDQVREYLMSNPELWSGKGEQKAGPLSSVEATAKALEGVDTSKIINPLSEKQFDKKYIAQHKDLQGKKEGTWRSNKTQILKNGLKEGVNVNALPIYTGSERNVIDKQYGNREGDIVYILPKEGVSEGRNGYKTKEGYIPKLSEIIIVEYDKQPTYEAYKNQLKSASYISEAYHAAKKDGTNPELVKAVEDLLGEKAEGKQAAPNSPESIAARIRNKKQKGALSAIDFGISVTIYNGALDFMASQVEKGTKLGNAIANTIKWIDDKMKGEKWNKGAFGKYMNDTYKVTLGDGREVEVVRDDSKETAEVINGWYQPIEQKVLDSKEESLPANKWAERLKSKEDEDLWTGVRAFLEEKGTERVSRKELLDFIKDNRIEIVTVVKRERDLSPDKFDIDFRNGEFIVTRNGVDEKVFQSDAKANDYIAQQEIKDESKTTKFSQYQLPGDKENYKEVLVTLPKKLPIPDGNYIVYADKGAAERREYIKGFDTENEAFNWVKENKDKYPYTIDYETRKIVESIESGDVFKSSHFDEPNILVHLRMNTRTDAEGNKVLFLEEVQSDWGQKGKKEGFDLTEKEVKDKFDQADAALKSVEKKIDTKYGKDWDSRGDIEDVLSKEDYSEYQKAASERAKWGNLLGKEYKTGTPTAPFVMDTNAWVKLGLKTALQEAVRQGADKIAWTTGEQQNDRYDLSKQLSSITVDKTGQNSYMVMARSKGDERLVVDQSYRKEELPDIIGKELAADMVAEADKLGVYGGTVYRAGDGLSIGGKGMKGFYGSAQEGSKGIIGGVAEKLFGQKVGEVSINTGSEGTYNVVRNTEDVKKFSKSGWTFYEEKNGEYKKIDRNKAFENLEKSEGVWARNETTGTQSSISITPELKAQVKKGLPLFGTQLTPEQELKQAFDKWKSETSKLGIVPNWERQAKADIELFNALAEYVKKKLAQGAFSFDQFIKDLGKTNVENIDKDKERWRKFYNDAVAEKKEAPKAPPATPPTEKKEEGRKPVRELPEAPEGQVIKAVLGRSYQATTSQKVADAILKSGIFRTPGRIEAAFENGRKFVDDLGIDGAYELFQDLSTTFGEGIVLDEDTRLGIFSAITEDLQKKIFDPKTSKEDADKAAEMMAEVQMKASTLVSGGAKRLRIWQEILKNNTVPYQYEARVKEWKKLFPESPITKEMEDRLKKAEAKYTEIQKKFMELVEKQKEWEESQAVSDIKNDIENEKKAAKKQPASVLKRAAAKVRKGKTNRPEFFSAASPLSLAWDAAVEAVALVLEAGGSIEIAIKKGIKTLSETDVYKSLSKKDKKRAEAEFINHHADLIEEGVGMAEVVNGGIAIPHSLIRYYVSEGMTDINEIADAILDGLSEKYPDLTQKDIRDAITGYSKKVKQKTPDQINETINQLKYEGKLQSRLEDLKNGIVKEKNPKTKKDLSILAKNLQKEIDRIHEEMFGHTTKQMSDEQRLAAYKERAKARIKELRRRIAEGDFTKKEPRPPFDFDKEANDLELEKLLLDEQWAEMVRDEYDRTQGRFMRGMTTIFEALNLPRAIKVGIVDFGVGGIQGFLSSFNSPKQTAMAFSNAIKSAKSYTSYQKVEAALRAHPKYLEAKKAGVKFYSPTDPTIFKGDMIPVATLANIWNEFGKGLAYLAEQKFGKKNADDFYNYWEKVNPMTFSERTQAAFVNTLNLGMYLRGAEIAAQRGYTNFNKSNEEVFKDIADVANTLSRKSSLGGLENSRKFMTLTGAAMFSAQNYASIIKIASPYTLIWLANKRAGTNKLIETSPAVQLYGEIVGKAAISVLATYVLLKLATGWEDHEMDDEERKKKKAITINLSDSRRSDWMKVRYADLTFDFLSGLTQEMILTWRMFVDSELFGLKKRGRGFVSTKTGVEKYLGEGGAPSAPGLIGMQLLGKGTPTALFIYKWAFSNPIKGQPWYIRKMSLTNEEISLKEEFEDLFVNLTFEAIKEAYTEQDLLPASITSFLSFYGFGVQREERLEEKSISRQLKETLRKGKEYQVYEKALKDYAVGGDVELAKKVFEKAIGGRDRIKESITMIKEMADDNIPSKYSLSMGERGSDYNEFFSVLKTGRPINTKDMGPTKAARITKINELTAEQLDRLKSDYAVQYDEVMAAKKVFEQMNIKNKENKPINWNEKLESIKWLKEYEKAMGIKK